MSDNFRREYHVNAEGRLFAVDSWDGPDGTRIERRTSDMSEEDMQVDRADIEMAYLEHENEQASRQRRRRKGVMSETVPD
jgi:hypothetical protein